MSSTSKSLIITVLLLIVNMQSFTQFSVEGYLAAPFQSAEIRGLVEQLQYMDDESFRSPIFRELELRIRTDDLNMSPDDIRLRLGFLNPFEQVANRSYENIQNEYLEVKYEVETNQLLANRYKQLIRHYFLSMYEEILGAEIDNLVIAYEQLQTGKLSLKDWVETDERILKKELKRKDVETSNEMIEYYIREIIKIEYTPDWDNFEFITVEKMQEVILPDTAILLPDIALAMKSLELDQQEWKVDKARSWSNIGFIQAEYDLDGEDVHEDLGFQLGISLPLFNTDKPDLQRKKLELIDQEYQLQEVKDETTTEQFSLDQEFQYHSWSFRQVSDRISEIEALGETLTYDNMEEYLALINYHSNLLILKHEIYYECLLTYIEILALSGRFFEPPYINYISNNLTPLSF